MDDGIAANLAILGICVLIAIVIRVMFRRKK